MATVDFISRIIGLFIFTFLGARFGVDAAETISLPADASATIFGLVGALFGLTLTPWVSVRPLAALNQDIKEMPIDRFIMALVGGAIGLVLALLLAYPLSLLPPPFDELLPPLASVLGGYLGVTVFRVRAKEIWDWLGRDSSGSTRRVPFQASRKLLVDTSVLIDGRIVDIAETGFIGGSLMIPRFVMTELHQVADSPDPLRRNRGRRGVDKLKELTRSEVTPVKIIDDDILEIDEVDDKLVALALDLDASLITNDYPLAKVAEAQGVLVLNINLLANAVRSVYIPGERFPLHIIQEGTDEGQGVGYLDDGTMVVVENGKRYMDRTIRVEVTKLINRPAGRMIFANPEN
jgi:uncharacterized protein YacL